MLGLSRDTSKDTSKDTSSPFVWRDKWGDNGPRVRFVFMKKCSFGPKTRIIFGQMGEFNKV